MLAELPSHYLQTTIPGRYIMKLLWANFEVQDFLKVVAIWGQKHRISSNPFPDPEKTARFWFDIGVQGLSFREI